MSAGILPGPLWEELTSPLWVGWSSRELISGSGIRLYEFKASLNLFIGKVLTTF